MTVLKIALAVLLAAAVALRIAVRIIEKKEGGKNGSC